MSKLDTQSVVTLIINGEQSKTTLKEVTGAVNSLRSELGNMRKEDNPEQYDAKIEKLQQLREAQAAMRQEIMATRPEVKGFFSDFEKGFEEIERIAAGVTIGTIVSGIVRGAMRSVEEFFSDSEEKFREAQVTQAQLEAVLKSTGGAAGETMEQLKKYQDTLSDQDAVEEKVVAKSEELLLTFTNVKGVVYEKALPAIMDLTAALNGGKITMEGVQKVTLQVGKALNDPIQGMSALRRVGVSFTAAQKEQITVMEKSGNTMGAQMLILKELQKEFGGTAEAIRNTSTGALQLFNVDMDKLKERVGGWMTDFKGFLAGMFDGLVKSIGDARSEAEKLTDDFNDQKESVDSLQKNTLPLLDRYDELTTKGKLNHNEQDELKKVINEIAGSLPNAVTQWDKYGNALTINTSKARDLVKAQQDLLEYQNKSALESNRKQLADLKEKQQQLQEVLNSGKTTDIIVGSGSGYGSSSVDRDLTPKEINDMRAQLKGITGDIEKTNNVILMLSGKFMDDTHKKVDATAGAIKKLTDMTIGELQTHLQELDAQIKDTVSGSADWKKLHDQILETEKLLNPDKTAKREESEKAKAARELAEYQKQLAELQAQIDALINRSTKGTEEGLDSQLKLINDKYQQIIDKIKKIDISKFASAADHKKNAANIQATGDANMAEQGSLINESEYKGELQDVKQFTDQKQALLDEQRSKDKISEEEYQRESEKLLKESLEKQFMLELEYGENTLDTEKKLHELELREEQRVANEKKKLAEDELKFKKSVAEEKEKLQQAEAGAVQSGFELATAIFGKSKALKIAEIAFEKFAAVEKIQAQTGIEIAKYYATYADIPFAGVAIASGLAAMAETREAIEIASVLAGGLAQAIGDLSSGSSKGGSSKKMADGGIIGPSHAAGGVPLINGHTGEQIAELEGGEHMAVFSKNTSANNRMLISELLYNSQYRNGEPVTVNATGAEQAMQHYRTGSAQQFAHTTGIGGSTANGHTSAGTDMAETNRLLAGLHDKFDQFSKKPWSFDHKAFEDYDNLVQDSRAAANAK